MTRRQFFFRHVSFRFILMLSLHLLLARHHFQTGFPTKILRAFLVSPVKSTVPARRNFTQKFTVLTIVSDMYKSRSSSLCNFLNHTHALFMLFQNVILSSSLSDTWISCCSLIVKGPIFQPYKTEKIVVIVRRYLHCTNLSLIKYVGVNCSWLH